MQFLHRLLITTASLLLLLACDKKIDISVETPDISSIAGIKTMPDIKPTVDVSLPDADANLPELFSRLDKQFSKNNIQPSAPISDQEITALELQLPCKLPPILRAMYRWHNGIPDFTPPYEFQALNKVVEEYKFFKRINKEYGVKEGEGWPAHFLPILQFNGKMYVALDCKDQGPTPLFSYFIEDGTPQAKYRGPAHLLQVTLSSYESGAYKREFENMEVDTLAEARAFRQHAFASELQTMEDNWAKTKKFLMTAKGENFRAMVGSMDPDERAIPLLIDKLHDAGPEEIVYICLAFGNFKSEATRPALNDLLKHKSSRARDFAASALSKLRGPQSQAETDTLLSLLEDSDKLVQLSAIEALKHAKSYRAIDTLIDKLHRSKPGMQAYIIRTLADIGDRHALPALKELQASFPAQLDSKRYARARGDDPSPADFKSDVDEAIRRFGQQ
ncbi:hypothetical protein UNDKW_4203 [Undibacterium sp. KW1]|uniref:HEAT repeat domain-containing protein n=1 Tax=Undibacterium sp. KW1 TaxID=2058624 RepID=UPI001331F5F4|nr:HEAT repeat domain-containing protein [Undibacterium sp. KW1]BBB62476.1 hypothetical protein UNDKW_4203 [Undibacterium sp. KW1]